MVWAWGWAPVRAVLAWHGCVRGRVVVRSVVLVEREERDARGAQECCHHVVVFVSAARQRDQCLAIAVSWVAHAGL